MSTAFGTHANANETAPHGNGANAATGMHEKTVRSFSPITGELLAELPAATREDVLATVLRARKAQAAWAIMPVEERAARLLRFRDAIVEHMDEIVDVIVRECGKPRQEALVHEVVTLLDLTTYWCKHAPKVLAPETLDLHLMKHRKSVVHHVPRGVIGIVSPWNFPFVIPMSSVVAALLAGNAAVVKPSEVTPLVLLKAKAIFDSTGLPEDLFGVVIGHGNAGQALIESGIDKMMFTGSVATGKRVAAACGARLVPCVMELGGKAPLIACADADVERTARAIVFGGFANSGQACISVERVYAHEKIHEELVVRVRDLVRELRQGDASRGEVDVGAMIFAKQIDVVEAHIEDALAKGATLVAGGHAKPGPGLFFEPTVLANCDATMTVMREEIFGPIVPIQRVASEEEAIALANDSHLGLNAYVFTKDRTKGMRIAERIQAGSVVENDVLSNYGATEAPFGGIKQSGYGRVHGLGELTDMCETRHVSVDRLASPTRDPLWFPYSAKTHQWVQRGARALFGRGGIVKKLARLF